MRGTAASRESRTCGSQVIVGALERPSRTRAASSADSVSPSDEAEDATHAEAGTVHGGENCGHRGRRSPWDSPPGVPDGPHALIVHCFPPCPCPQIRRKWYRRPCGRAKVGTAANHSLGCRHTRRSPDLSSEPTPLKVSEALTLIALYPGRLPLDAKGTRIGETVMTPLGDPS